SEAGVDDDAARCDAGDDEFGDAVFEFFAHGAHDVGVGGELVHGGGLPAPVHGYVVEAAFGGDPAHPFVCEAAGDVVDDGDAGFDGGFGGGAAHGVDADGDAAGDEFGDDGQYAPFFFEGVDAGGAGAGGFAADVDDVGATGDEVFGVGDGAVDGGVFATVAE